MMLSTLRRFLGGKWLSDTGLFSIFYEFWLVCISMNEVIAYLLNSQL